MNKFIKVILIVIVIIFLDIYQAIYLDNTPLLHIKKIYDGNIISIDKGILTDTYTCNDNTKHTVFKWNTYICTNDDTSSEIIVNDIDSFYSVINYTDLRELDDYTKDDDALIIDGAKVYNDYLYEEFMNDYENNTNSFIRVVNINSNNDIVIYDVLYYNDLIYIVYDKTKDTTLKTADRTIEYQEYGYVSETVYASNTYFIAYNGSIDDISFENNQVLIIALIN